jgi:hypothetical protein
MNRHRLLLTFLFAFSLGVIAAVYFVRHEQDLARDSVAGETASAATAGKSATDSHRSAGNDDSGDDVDSAPTWPDGAGTPEQVNKRWQHGRGDLEADSAHPESKSVPVALPVTAAKTCFATRSNTSKSSCRHRRWRPRPADQQPGNPMQRPWPA